MQPPVPPAVVLIVAIWRIIAERYAPALASREKKAGTDAANLQAGIETWYNSAMDRDSGCYRRSLKNLFKSAATQAGTYNDDPLGEFYQNLLAHKMAPPIRFHPRGRKVRT
jgi:hypothetical protein